MMPAHRATVLLIAGSGDRWDALQKPSEEDRYRIVRFASAADASRSLPGEVAVIVIEAGAAGGDVPGAVERLRGLAGLASVPVVVVYGGPAGGSGDGPPEPLPDPAGPFDYFDAGLGAEALKPRLRLYSRLSTIARDSDRQDKFLAAVLNTIGSLVLLLDAQGRIVRTNRAWEEVLGFPAAEASGKPVSRYMRAAEPAVADFFEKVREEAGFDDTWITRSGAQRRIEWRPTRFADGPGKGSEEYFVVSGIDVTERMRLDQERRDRTEELEGFTYSVSHDLRAPIRAIDGFTRIITEEYAQQMDDEGRRLLKIVRMNTHKMGELIDGLLALSRIGREPMRKGDIDMGGLAKGIVEEHQGGIDPARTVDFQIQDSIPPAAGDRRLIAQVFENLISNALKFTRDKSPARIEVGAKTSPTHFVYFVRDNGVGFDMSYSHKLFGTFQRLHAVTEFEGTGIGLATVRRIVERHGGSVWAESELGRGAAFYFSLPRSESRPPEPGSSNPAPRGGG